MRSPAKQRADQLVFARGLAASRSQAEALILAGRVFANQARVEKAGTLLSVEVELSVSEGSRYVSRGGLKLEAALSDVSLDVAGKVCLDVGASTGGFSDCLLQHGAARVYAVDVGKGLLAEKLRRDPRVVVMEETNARYLERANFPEALELAVVDASFISLDKLLPALKSLLHDGARLLALVKPQFEAGRRDAGRGRGVIRDPEVRERAIGSARSAIETRGFRIDAECTSALPGPKGNLEHFVLATRGD